MVNSTFVIPAHSSFASTALKQRLARQTWQEIVVRVYADYPHCTVESELLPKIRKTQTKQQPE